MISDPTMTTIEILEGPDDRLFLHLNSMGKATALVPIDTDEHMSHLERTVDSPTPFEDRGNMPFEVLVGGDGRYVFVDIDDVMSTLVPVERDEDLHWLRHTIRSPQSFSTKGITINQV